MSVYRDETVCRFGEELEELIARWKRAPMDDRLTYAAMIGALYMMANSLTREAAASHGQEEAE